MTSPVHQLSTRIATVMATHLRDGGGGPLVGELAQELLNSLSAENRQVLLADAGHLQERLAQLLLPRLYQVKYRDRVMKALGVGPRGDQPTRLFFSYRRSEAVQLVARIVDRFKTRPQFAIFFDQNNLTAGPFPQQLERAIRLCDVFVLFLAPETLKRTHEPDDWIRREIETALGAQKPIVPVLLDERAFPSVSEFPASIAAVTQFNALPFNTNSPFAFEASVNALQSWVKKRR